MQIALEEYEHTDDYRALIENYPGQPQHLLAIMQDVQKQYNYLPRWHQYDCRTCWHAGQPGICDGIIL
jgi:NADH:ubiquinone oxidoreductase subunit E